GRGRRRDHALELPDRDPRVEALSGARLWQHGRPQAGRRHAAARAALRRSVAGSRPPRRSRADRARLRRGSRGSARAPPRRPGDHVHRLTRDRRPRDEERRRRAQARAPGAWRQERDHRDGRRVISGGADDEIHSYTGIGRDEGAKLVTGGERVEGQGYYYRPTVFADVEPQMRIAQEEIFGPTTALIPVDSFEDAVAAANSVKYGLSSSIFTRDVNKAFKAMRDLQTGITYINAGTTGAEVHLPFGGMKQTGNGHREAGQAALDVFTEWKSVYVDYSGKLQRAQI